MDLDAAEPTEVLKCCDCSVVVAQLAAASRALDRAGFKIISTGMRQCIISEDAGSRRIHEEELEHLFLTLA